jgi:hypothetical protein
MRVLPRLLTADEPIASRVRVLMLRPPSSSVSGSVRSLRRLRAPDIYASRRTQSGCREKRLLAL